MPVSIVMLVKGVVPIEISSFVNWDSYSHNTKSWSFCTAVDSSWHGRLKVSGVTVSDIIFFNVMLFDAFLADMLNPRQLVYGVQYILLCEM